MDRALAVPSLLAVVIVFVSVLFAELLPLPLDGYASQRYILAIILVLGCTFACADWVSRSDWQGFKEMCPAFIVTCGFLLLAAPFRAVSYAWVEPGMYAAFFLGFALIGNLIGNGGRKHRWVVALVYTAIITAVFYGGVTIIVYLFALSDRATNVSAFIPWGFVNIRYWSHVATWLMPLLAVAPLIGPFRSQRLWRIFCAVGAGLWWWVVVLSSSRGTMLGLAFGVLVAGVFIGRPTLPWLRVFLRYLFYGVLAWLLLSVLIPSLLFDETSIRTLKLDSSGRMPLFIEAWRMSLENFPFGLGPQAWLTHEILTEEYQQSSKFGHPHNMYLMWAAEYGWLIIGAILVLVCQAIWLFWQRRAEVRAGDQREQALLLAAFTASVSAALLHAGVSAVFMAPGSMLIGFLVLCLFWALILPNRSPTSARTRVGVLLAIVTTAVLSALFGFWLREVTVYHQAMEDDRDARYQSVPYGTPPRFWYYGDFPRRLE